MHFFLMIGLVAFSILAVLSRDLLRSAISLAVASVFLAVIFFRMNAVYAGVFEISVVAGLITVLFITTIALTRGDQEVVENKRHLLIFPLFFLILIVIDILVMKNLLGKIPAIVSSESGTFGEVLWNQRTFDLVGQIGVILAGVLAVLALFRQGKKTHDGGKE
ncbi:MAG: NADH-quinone oxidoreductase subunit J [Candidatus Aminicenantes bacterium]|nr:NADH-quinone oxidoreductase subunit J [Acidobacteriota bacterium]MBU4404863.1 NADH-quinone oxidoreductase subunit J [Acidobacteriota bacterium]MCG2812406.1 NADH-quinone oxidoreductase subunit J [Candidatus Aminicenantes bacterium]